MNSHLLALDSFPIPERYYDSSSFLLSLYVKIVIVESYDGKENGYLYLPEKQWHHIL